MPGSPLPGNSSGPPSDVHEAARCRAFLQQEAVGIVEVDASGRFLFVNQKFCTLTGYTESELLNRSFLEITHPQHRVHNAEAVQRLRRGGVPTGFEKRYIRKDGSEVWVYLSVMRIQPQPGADPTFLSVVLDISERRRAENEARRHEQQYRTLFNSLDMGFCVIEVLFNPDGTAADYVFLEMNAVFEKVTGLANARQRRMRELAPSHEQYWFDIYGRIARTGEPIRFEQEARALQRWYSVYAFRIGEPQEHKVGVLFEDITVRRHSEQRRLFLSDLAEKLAPLRNEQDITETAVTAVGRFLQVDRCFFVECMEAEDRIVVSEDYARDGRPSIAGEKRLSDFGGPAWWLAYSAGNFAVADVATHPLTQNDAPAYAALDVRAYLVQPFKQEGPARTVLGIATSQPHAWSADDLKLIEDVVARVWPVIARARADRALFVAHAELERRVADRTAKLQETVSELESYSYSISHDLRAPLRAMQTYASILTSECGGQLPAEGREYLRRIMTAAERMDALIRDVLVVSRVSRASMPLERIELGSFISDIIDSYPGLRVSTAEIELVSPLGAVRANPAALTQCVSNLLGNAIKFVAPGVKPRLRIWSVAQDNRRRLFIRDNGIGIAPDAHEKIFGMFYQIDSSYDGTGVGLAVVRKATERMGGTVGLESAPGEGGTFWLELADATGAVTL